MLAKARPIHGVKRHKSNEVVDTCQRYAELHIFAIVESDSRTASYQSVSSDIPYIITYKGKTLVSQAVCDPAVSVYCTYGGGIL